MAVVTDKIRSVVDFFVKGFEPKETIFDEMGDEIIEDDYEVEDNLAIDPAYTYQQRPERTQDLKVVNHPNYRGYEIVVMEPRSFDDAAQIVQYLKDRKTIAINLHLLDKEQSQRTIDFVCGAALALNGKPQKVGDLFFLFTPSNVKLTVDMNQVQSKFSDSLWRAPMQ